MPAAAVPEAAARGTGAAHLAAARVRPAGIRALPETGTGTGTETETETETETDEERYSSHTERSLNEERQHKLDPHYSSNRKIEFKSHYKVKLKQKYKR